MADDRNLESKLLIAQGYGPIVKPVVKEIIRRVFDAGSAGEDNGTLEKLRKGDHPVRQLNTRPAQSQRRQGNYPVQTTLPHNQVISQFQSLHIRDRKSVV